MATLLRVLVIAAIGAWVYSPCFHGGWLGDDDLLVSANSLVHDPDGLWKIWFDPANNLIDYQPVKFSAVWLQWHLWGNHTLGYHLTNVFLHLISCLLVWRLLAKIGLRRAWLGGVIFAVHPVNVESVAYISEFKNTLSLPLFLLAMSFWIDFEEHRSPRDYLLSLGFFVVTMLCKATAVMFPVLILLFAWWKREKIGLGDLRNSAPFFAVSAILGVVIDWFLNHHAIGNQGVAIGGIFSRLALASLTTSFYLLKGILPVGLMPVYPRWIVDPPSLSQFLPLLVLAGLIFWFWTKRHSWGRDALLGIGFFFINLAPFIGFISGSYMIFSWVTDHTLYIPIIGLIGLMVGALNRLYESLPLPARCGAVGLIAVAITLLALESHSYARIYRNKEIYCNFALKQNPGAVPAHLVLGYLDLSEGRTSAALEHGLAAEKFSPHLDQAHVLLGKVYLKMGELTEAEKQFDLALSLDPDDTDAISGLANLLAQSGRFTEALDRFNGALALRPNDATLLSGRAQVRRCLGDLAGATYDAEKALALDPDLPEAHLVRGVVSLAQEKPEVALADFRRFRELAPKDPNADYVQLWIWILLSRQNQGVVADQELSGATRTNWNASPTDWVTQDAKFLLGQINEVNYFAAAGDDPARQCEARYYVGVKRLLAGDKASAAADFRACVATGKTDFFEYTFAVAQLNQLMVH